jgi:tripartite-type tricarboxylate transporter receptor subunit TctC
MNNPHTASQLPKKLFGRRLLVQAAAFGTMLCTLPLAHAQAPAWPSKPVRVVVAFAPGGPADIVARIIAQVLQDKLGQTVVVDNRGGAGGNIAARLVAKEVPDGYTLLVTTSALAVNQTFYKEPGYDALKSFSPVALISISPNIIVAHPSSPASDLKDYFQKNKGKSVSYGSAGIGSTPHLTGDHVLRVLGGLEAVHIPFQGAGPALAATMANQVEIASVALPPAVPLVRSGKLKALAVTSLQRIEALPQVPTVAESGFAGFEDYTWVGLFGPAKLPPEMVSRVNSILAEALRTPEMKVKLAAAGMEPKPGTAAEFGDYVQREVTKWAQIVKATGVTPQ